MCQGTSMISARVRLSFLGMEQSCNAALESSLRASECTHENDPVVLHDLQDLAVGFHGVGSVTGCTAKSHTM